MAVRAWKSMSELTIDPKTTVYIDVREVTTYRWKPYKPDGARQMRATGRWQRTVGEYGKWENCSQPAGEWSPNETGRG